MACLDGNTHTATIDEAPLYDAERKIPGIGPILFPTALSAGVWRGSLIAAVVVTAVTLLLIRSPSPTRWTGAALIGLYLVLYPALLA